jgi:hypothetical protein
MCETFRVDVQDNDLPDEERVGRGGGSRRKQHVEDVVARGEAFRVHVQDSDRPAEEGEEEEAAP